MLKQAIPSHKGIGNVWQSSKLIEAYRPYLLAREFDLYTDHQSLKWLLTRTKEHSGRLWRWVDKIQEIEYTLKHIARTKNKVADALSRIRFVEIESEEDRSLEYRKPPTISPGLIFFRKRFLMGAYTRGAYIRGAYIQVAYINHSNNSD